VRDNQFILHDLPPRLESEDVKRVLLHAANIDASDIIMRTNAPIMVQRYAQYYPLTTRALTDIEVGLIVNDIYGANGTSILKGGEEIDRSHDIWPERNKRVRFRMNATSCVTGGTTGIEITLRVIVSTPPKWEDLGIEKEIEDAIAPAQGMVLITGETGSGKSTLLASNIRRILEDPVNNRRIITYEKPIEYVYDDIDCALPLITQTEIGRNIREFDAGIVNAMRRNPSIILIGESRDKMTMDQSIVAANTGHLLYTTIHSNGVSSTMRRMVNLFPEGERDAKMVDILESLRLVVTQRLLETVDGKRCAVREYLVFDQDVKNILYETPMEKIPVVTRRLVHERGQSLLKATGKRLEEGRITEETYRMIQRISDGMDREAEVAHVA
jgi:defect-in-organelle-trafficking protein DotB